MFGRLNGRARFDPARYACATALYNLHEACLLYTSDAADERSSVDLGGRRIIKKKKNNNTRMRRVVSVSNL